MECQNLGMDKNDEDMIGLLFLVSIFYTTLDYEANNLGKNYLILFFYKKYFY